MYLCRFLRSEQRQIVALFLCIVRRRDNQLRHIAKQISFSVSMNMNYTPVQYFNSVLEHLSDKTSHLGSAHLGF